MRCWRILVTAGAMLTGGCAPGVSGVVRDAATERPVGGAVVELRDSGWGIRRNQLVWDAEKISRATTDAGGRFRLDSDGGHGLRITARGHAAADTSLCARSPMVVRIGGPYAEREADRRLVFEQKGSSGGRLAMVEDVALRASGGAFSDGEDLRIETSGSVRFVPGTGTIPRPPPLPYDRSVDLDLRSNCGWLFVSNGTSPVAVIRVRPLAREQHPGHPLQWLMMYSPLPG